MEHRQFLTRRARVILHSQLVAVILSIGWSSLLPITMYFHKPSEFIGFGVIIAAIVCSPLILLLSAIDLDLANLVSNQRVQYLVELTLIFLTNGFLFFMGGTIIGWLLSLKRSNREPRPIEE